MRIFALRLVYSILTLFKFKEDKLKRGSWLAGNIPSDILEQYHPSMFGFLRVNATVQNITQLTARLGYINGVLISGNIVERHLVFSDFRTVSIDGYLACGVNGVYVNPSSEFKKLLLVSETFFKLLGQTAGAEVGNDAYNHRMLERTVRELTELLELVFNNA